ncbi:MAG: Sodium/glucose cotransporter [Bacteroidia bacterium]|nr:Sodium/glucose cotransporter [Bacteroidia bacterium]
MSPLLIISCIAGYFSILLLIAWWTSRNANNSSYFLGNKASPWYAVAFGMISDSLSGVTFISVPGAVGASNFSYLQLVLGYVVGYYVIGSVLLPLYYRLNLTSIYTYLLQRFGNYSQKTGSFFFLLSRTLGAAGRLFLAAGVIQLFVFDHFGIPFWLSVSVIIILMLVYTYKGGIKTLVWTDTFQSAFLLLGVVLSIAAISSELNLSFAGMTETVINSSYSKVFFWDWQAKSFFPKQFFGGMFIAIVMTGLDQNMMQKNLSCKSLGEAQKNIYWFSIVMAIVNVFFLSLGVLLYTYSESKGIAIPAKTDNLFPMLALQHLGTFAGLVFIIGLTAATFSSADSVLTTLTTSFYIDFLDAENKSYSEKKKTTIRHIIHIAFAVILLLVILVFKAMNNAAIIDTVLMLAGYTYGPLLGMFAFGLFTKQKVNDKMVPLVCVLSPLLCYYLNLNSVEWLGGYKFGNELLLLNGTLTFAGLRAIRKK